MEGVFMSRDLVELCRAAAKSDKKSDPDNTPYFLGRTLHFYSEWKLFENCQFNIKHNLYSTSVPLTLDNLMRLFGRAGGHGPYMTDALCYQDQIALYYTLTVDEINGLISTTENLITLLQKLPAITCVYNNIYVQELFLTQHFEKLREHINDADQLMLVLRYIPLELQRHPKIIELIRDVLAKNKTDQYVIDTLCGMPQKLILPALELSKKRKLGTSKIVFSKTQSSSVISDWTDVLHQRIGALQASHGLFGKACKKNKALIVRFLSDICDVNTCADAENTATTPYSRYIQLEAFLNLLTPEEHHDLVDGHFGKKTKVAFINFVGFEHGSEDYAQLKKMLEIQHQLPISSSYKSSFR